MPDEDAKECKQEQGHSHESKLTTTRGLLSAGSNILLQSCDVGIAAVDGLQTVTGYVAPETFKGQLAHDDAQRIDVVAHVGHTAGSLLGRHILTGAGGLLQVGMTVGIGQGEVDELDMLTIAGEHDIGRLQVAMGDGRGMHVGKRLEEFVNDVLARVGISHSALLNGLTQRLAFNIFKHNALAHGNAPTFTVDIVVEMFQPQAANDVGMVE